MAYITNEWWAHHLNTNINLLIGCALGAPDEAIFLERLTECETLSFEDDAVYNDIVHFVGDVNTWRYVAHASYNQRATEADGPARLCVENIDMSYDIVGIQNGHLIVQESDGWYGSVTSRPRNYDEALAWVTAHQS